MFSGHLVHLEALCPATSNLKAQFCLVTFNDWGSSAHDNAVTTFERKKIANKLEAAHTNVSHLDLVGDDGSVVEAHGGLPGDEDVGVGHGFDDRAVGAAGNVTKNNADGGGHLRIFTSINDIHLNTNVSICHNGTTQL